MFPEEMDPLLTLAEIAIAMAGFSAIVVLFKRRDSGTWLAADADRFHGMILHSMAAAALCLVPAAIGVFTGDASRLWRVASGVMALQVLVHAGIVVLRLKTTGPGAAAMVAIGALLVVSVQLLAIAGVYFQPGAGPYALGVLWHLLQAGFLFTFLVWVHEGSIER